jgi:hypothetical protein
MGKPRRIEKAACGTGTSTSGKQNENKLILSEKGRNVNE